MVSRFCNCTGPCDCRGDMGDIWDWVGCGPRPGPGGKSAYEIAVENGFKENEERWLASLKGAKGDKGDKGDSGKDGAAGLPGAKGDPGKDGEKGDTGPQGIQGVDGKSAYQLAVEDGFKGTVTEYLKSLKGTPGSDGVDGKDGTNGKSAYDLAVESGFKGTVTQWLESLIGPQGIPGEPGKTVYEVAVDNGYLGSEEQWLESLKGIPGETGGSAYQLAQEKGFVGTEEQWLETLVGPQGPQGIQGEKGVKGDKGDTGPKGETGPAGPAGPQGIQGVTGAAGAKGATGAKGDKGDTGAQGPQGPQGVQGPKGDVGPTGPKGDKGEKGDSLPELVAGTGIEIDSSDSEKSIISVIADYVTKEDLIRFVSGEEIELNFMSDFTGKVRGSLTENANVFYQNRGEAIFKATDFVSNNERNQEHIDNIKKLDNVQSEYGVNIDKQMVMYMFSYNLIDIITRRLGESYWTAQGARSVAEKAEIIREKAHSDIGNIWGFGSSPTGNKLSVAVWAYTNSAWQGGLTHNKNSVTKIARRTDNLKVYMSNEGIMNFIAYAEPSDGTVASTVNIDYANIEFKLKIKLSDFVYSKSEADKRTLDIISGNETVNEVTEMISDSAMGTASRFVKDLPGGNNYLITNDKGQPTLGGYVGTNGVTGINNGILKLTKTASATYHDAYFQIGATDKNNGLKLETGQRWVFGANVKGAGSLIIYYKLSGEDSHKSGINRFTTTTFENKFTTVTLPADVVAFFVRFRFLDGAATGSTIEAKEMFLKLDSETYSPAPEDMGVVHGQPNIIPNSDFSKFTSLADLKSRWNISKEANLSFDFTASQGVTVVTSNSSSIADSRLFLTADTNVLGESYTILLSVTMKAGAKIFAGPIQSASDSAIFTAPNDGQYSIVFPYEAPVNNAPSILFYSANKEYVLHKIKQIKGTLDEMGEWTPNQTDFEGAPNLLDDTSDQWEEYTFSGYTPSGVSKLMSIASLGLKVGDTISFSYEADNTNSGNIDPIRAVIAFKKSDLSTSYYASAGTFVSAGTVGYAKTSGVIQEEITHIQVDFLNKNTNTNSATARCRKHKLVKGDVDQLGIWVPKNRTEYDKTLGMVPFTTADYETLQSADGVIRAETKIVGRGAEIQFDFDVIRTLDKKYPYLFENCSTMAEKIAKLQNAIQKVSFIVSSRGGGLNSTNGNQANLTRLYQDNGTIFLYHVDLNNTATLKNSEYVLPEAQKNTLIDTNGIYKFSILSRTNHKNHSTHYGVLSDGVTPAWVEVKDIKLVVELNINGRTIIETFIAKYDAEHSVSLDGDQTVNGVKNFLEVPTINGDQVAKKTDITWSNTKQKPFDEIGHGFMFSAVGTPDGARKTLHVDPEYLDDYFISKTLDQTISGLKDFLKTPTVNGKKVVVMESETVTYNNSNLPGLISSGSIVLTRESNVVYCDVDFQAATTLDGTAVLMTLPSRYELKTNPKTLTRVEASRSDLKAGNYMSIEGNKMRLSEGLESGKYYVGHLSGPAKN